MNTGPGQRGVPLRISVCVEKADQRLRQINRQPRLWLSVFAAFMAVQISPWWYPSEDSCAYLSLARSIAYGEGMYPFGRPQVEIPPGYPLLISPAFWCGDRPFLAVALLHWFMAVATMLGVYRWMRQQFPSAAVLITGLTMVNMGVWYYYRRTLKEIAFMAVVIWTVNAMHDLLRASNGREIFRRSVPAVLLLLLAVLIRYSGIVLIAGFGVACLVKLSRSENLRRRALPVLGAIGAGAAAMWLIVMNVGGEVYLRGFLDSSADLGTRLADGVWLQVNGIGRATVPGMFKAYADRGQWWDINMLVYVLVVLGIALGWWQFVRRRNDVLAMTLPFYLVLYMAWPFNQGARFVVPMVPVLMACLWFSGELLLRNRSVLYVLLFGGHLGAGLGYWLVLDAPRAWEDHQYWATVERISESIPTDRDKVLAVGVPDNMDLMLQVALDQPISLPDEMLVPRPNIRWIVQPVDNPTPADFSVRRVAGDLQVLARGPQSFDDPAAAVSKSPPENTRQR